MENTDLLPDNTPVSIRSGRYKNRLGRINGKPDKYGLYYVLLEAATRSKAAEASFTRSQLHDLRQAAATCSR